MTGRLIDLTECRREIIRLATSEKEPVTFAEFDCLIKLAFRSALIGEEQACHEFLAAVHRVCLDHGRTFLATAIRLHDIHLLASEGRIEDCLAALTEVASYFGDVFQLPSTPDGLANWEAARQWPDEGDRHVLFSLFYLTIGHLLAAGGDYAHGIELLERALVHGGRSSTIRLTNVVPAIRLTLASALLESGYMTRAASLICRLTDDIGQPSADTITGIRCHELSAHMCLLTGRFALAAHALERVVNAITSEGMPEVEARARLNLAHVYILLHALPAAKEELDHAEQIAAPFGARDLLFRIAQLRHFHDSRFRCFHNGSLSVAQLWGEPSTCASRCAGETIAIRYGSRPASFLAWFTRREFAFHSHLQKQRWSDAARALEAIDHDFAFSDSVIISNRCRTLHAALAVSLGNYEEAISTLQPALETFESRGLTADLWEATHLLGRAEQHLLGAPSPTPARVETWRRLLHQMTQQLPPGARFFFMTGKWAAEESILRSDIDRLVALRSRHRRKDASVALSLDPELLRSLRALINTAFNNRRLLMTECLGDDAPSTDCTRDFLDVTSGAEDRAALYFVTFPDCTLVAVGSAYGVDCHLAPVGRDKIRELVARWHMIMRGHWRSHEYPRIERHANLVSEELTECLQLSEILGALPTSIERLVIIPDDSLHGFPFAALRIRGEYLIHRYAVSLGVPQQSVRNGPPVIRSALLAPVTCGTTEYPAPGAVADVAWFFRLPWIPPGKADVHLLHNSQITRSALMDLLPSCSLFHFVGHGQFDAGNPEATGLVVVPDGTAQVLSLHDIAHLRCSRLEHVTLVACWGADSYVTPARWIVGLPDLFLRAGAKTVLASLWEAEQRHAHEFMTSYYPLLASYQRDIALRQVQLMLLERRRELRDWANWQLYGDTTPLAWASADVEGLTSESGG